MQGDSVRLKGNGAAIFIRSSMALPLFTKYLHIYFDGSRSLGIEPKVGIPTYMLSILPCSVKAHVDLTVDDCIQHEGHHDECNLEDRR